MRPPEAPSAGQLLWRCRRGMKELDVLLERYARSFDSSSADERRTFARLLDLADPTLAAYLLGQERAGDPELADIIARIAQGAHPPDGPPPAPGSVKC
jgi:antitoxin CptB